MIMRSHIPPPPLSDFVGLFWYFAGSSPVYAKERCLPTGTTELVINLREDRIRIFDNANPERYRQFCGSIVCGTQSEFFVIDRASEEEVIGVHFKPGGAFPFLPLPAGELLDEHVGLDDLWGAAAHELREQLLSACTPETRFAVLERWLLARLKRPLARHPAVSFALRAFQDVPHAQTIAQVSSRIGLSQRRFIQLFHEQVGLTPKLFCRVQRFQQVLRLIELQQRISWVDVATACGYYDQAHFIHDFQAFSGLNPKTYLTLRGERLNHVRISD